jgi:hypothetical protein
MLYLARLNAGLLIDLFILSVSDIILYVESALQLFLKFSDHTNHLTVKVNSTVDLTLQRFMGVDPDDLPSL